MNINFERISTLFHESHGEDDVSQLVIVSKGQEWVWCAGDFSDESLVNVYSLSKMMVTLCIFDLVHTGKIRLTDCLGLYWDAFACADKKNITINHVLLHASGLPHFGEKITTVDLCQWDKMTKVIENTSPLYPAGQDVSYHARSYGYLLAILVEKVTGQSFPEYFYSEIADKAGADFYFGINDAATKKRIIPLFKRNVVNNHVNDLSSLDSQNESTGTLIPEHLLKYTRIIFENPFNDILTPNHDDWISNVIPSSGGFSNALNIVRIMNYALKRYEGVFWSLCHSSPVQSRVDYALGFENRWHLGFVQNSGEFGTGQNRFGMRAIGGGLYFYDPEKTIHFSYTPARMVPQLGRFPAHDPRIVKILEEI